MNETPTNIYQTRNETSLLVRDTLDAECFLEAIENYIYAKSEHNKARDAYIDRGGYSWGYYGSDYIEAKEKAAQEFKEMFNKFVRKGL